MTRTTLVQTGVPGVAAAHIEATRASTHTTDDLTVVWSTEPVSCTPGDPAHLTWRLEQGTPPLVFDTNGCGDWTIHASRQCPARGQQVRLTPIVHERS
jgi:hypothetical protein